MMATRWHHEYMRVSPTRTDHLISKQGMCARLFGSGVFAMSCRVASWIVLPLHKAIWVFVYTALYCHCAAQGNRWRLAERHNDAKTHSLSSSQPAPRSKRFSQACPQTFAISHISGLARSFFHPYVPFFRLSESHTFKVRPCCARAFVLRFFIRKDWKAEVRSE